MENTQINRKHSYYCFNCQKNLSYNSELISCLMCDSSAIEICQNNNNEPFKFQIFDIKKNQNSLQYLGTLNNGLQSEDLQEARVSFSIIRIGQTNLISELRSQLGYLVSLSSLLRYLMENDDNSQGTSEEDIYKLEKIEVIKQCSICQTVQEEQKQSEKQRNNQKKEENSLQGYKLKCGHTFHKFCIQPWFEKSNSCPLCRRQIGEQQE